jgi:hypothetical protein
MPGLSRFFNDEILRINRLNFKEGNSYSCIGQIINSNRPSHGLCTPRGVYEHVLKDWANRLLTFIPKRGSFWPPWHSIFQSFVIYEHFHVKLFNFVRMAGQCRDVKKTCWWPLLKNSKWRPSCGDQFGKNAPFVTPIIVTSVRDQQVFYVMTMSCH